MKAKIISLDIDGVLRDFIYSLIFTYKKHNPDHKVIEPITSFSLENFFPIKEKIYDFYRFNAEEIFLTNAPAIKDSYKGVNYLRSMGFKIIITTSQKEETIGPTISWLKKFKIRYSKIYSTHDKHLVDFDIHIDDDPEQITNIVNANKKVIIFSTLQNKKMDRNIESKCIRVHNWNEVIDLFEDVSKVENHIKNFISFPDK